MTRRGGRHLSFPNLQRVTLTNFSLYSQRRKIELDVPDGVMCLAGANGIGKSTFLQAVNFALTGIVPNDSKKFESAKEYVEEGGKFSRTFFEGRIDEDDREEAEISVSFSIGDVKFEITRGAFEPSALRSLAVKEGNKSQLHAGLSPSERHATYCELVAKAVGVKTFEQFAFLQRFVFTFDESRHLLFWDARALEQALYLAFGGDAEIAAQASNLRREIDKADSRGRNVAFHASGVWDRIETIQDAIANSEGKSEEFADLRERHEALTNAQDAAEKEAEKAIAKAADAEVTLADASATMISLRKEYETTFAKLTGKRTVVDSHPLIKETLASARCALCGSEEGEAVAKVRDALKRHHCPLCDQSLQKASAGQANMLDNLKKIDANLQKARAKLDSAAAGRTRLVDEKAEAQSRLAKAEAELKAFEAKHEKRLMKAGEKLSGHGALAQTLANLREEHETLRAKSKEAYVKRDEFKKELKALQKKIEASYASAEEEFVPLFRKLAELFLGIELDIRLEGRMSTGGKITTGLSLVLELRETVRREQHQLSESQRFFVDIALRMAFAQFMSDKNALAALFIDTPEGSLDIAYESRAGEMFAIFVKGGHDLMMTANINSSQLLLKLAGECGKTRMELVRMTTWTELSEVQRKESKLFQDAFTTIEKQLRAANA